MLYHLSFFYLKYMKPIIYCSLSLSLSQIYIRMCVYTRDRVYSIKIDNIDEDSGEMVEYLLLWHIGQSNILALRQKVE